MATEYGAKLKVGKLNVDENQIAGKYGVMSIPSLLVFKDGQVIKTMVGAQSKDNFKKELDRILAN